MSHLHLVRPDEPPPVLPSVPEVCCRKCGLRLFVAWAGDALVILTRVHLCQPRKPWWRRLMSLDPWVSAYLAIIAVVGAVLVLLGVAE